MEHCFHLTCTPRLITATEYYFLRCMLLLKVNITFELLMCFFMCTLQVRATIEHWYFVCMALPKALHVSCRDSQRGLLFQKPAAVQES